MTPEEWDAAAASTTNAHYTSPAVISSMWNAARRLGFSGSTVLEPAGGVGHFLGLMPADFADRSRIRAVELDTVSGGILQKLYPEANVQVTGFQDANIPDNSVADDGVDDGAAGAVAGWRGLLSRRQSGKSRRGTRC